MTHHSQYYSSQLPPLECSQEQHVYLHPFFPITYEASSFPCPFFLDPSQKQERSHDPNEQQHSTDHHHHQQRQEANEHSGDHNSVPASLPAARNGGSGDDNNTRDDDPPKEGSVEWMPSKMRFMRKMMNSDRTVATKPTKNTPILQDQQQSTRDNNNNNSPGSNVTIRVCSDCNTTKTPLWRSGPRGPKTLCNACGIRQRKARRAIAAAAVSGDPTAADATTMKVRKEKRSDGDCTAPVKKRCKFTSAQARKKLRLDDFVIGLSENSALFHRVFPQDEKEAAILLMALSCGLIRG